MGEPPKLSLERPYKNDRGEHILNVIDITPEGNYILEPRESTVQKLGDNFRRIFDERGVDFFDKLKQHGISDDEGLLADQSDVEEDSINPIETKKGKDSEQAMTPEELFQMRKDILPQLHVAYGEMSQAKDLLSILLPRADEPIPFGLPVGSLASATVSKPSDIPSVQAFNSQLTLGAKDEALRKAALAFKTAAGSMERVRLRGEKYWGDALRTRNANWGLVPAPLPPWAPTGKGADKTARDFWITFGLAESPILFKRRAMAHLAVHESEDSSVIFPRHQPMRMRVSLVTVDHAGKQSIAHDTFTPSDDLTITSQLRIARDEIVDQEIFSQLIKEAAMLPTAAVRVSERLIVIEAAQNSEIRFELIESDTPSESPFASEGEPKDRATCDLIHSSLILLLLRAHKSSRAHQLSLPSTSLGKQRPPPTLPPLLSPVVNMLQYKEFCGRVEVELRSMAKALSRAGIPSKVRFNAVGETGSQLLDHLRGEDRTRIGGDASLRVNNRHTLLFTFLEPSTLVANLPQATLYITSAPQLCQLLRDEVERCLLESICDIGNTVSTSVDGTWFIDKLSNKCVGRWDTTVLATKFHFGSGPAPELSCTVIEVQGDREVPAVWKYNSEDKIPLLTWMSDLVGRACGNMSS